ncbi:ABC transporter ATP-binding protein [Gorillibacterium sp. sgz5001074]|uniref:ABC transporter ATP-binding protein n=1 Tax=Gorillibacterium sp. sgz5001074 TaxID=3446695 RepID=UPI003F66C722
MAEWAIECRNVTMKAKKKTILDGITFGVPAGSLTGLLGPNGAGKSTLFRLISGLVPPDAGSVSVFGQPAGPEQLIRIAALPDRGSLPGWLTAGEWLVLAEGLYPDWDPAASEELQISLGINRTAKIASMSRGEEARLQLLTCLARRAPLVILDEPFTGVDLLSRERIASSVVRSLADGDRTFLIATHDIREMENLFDRLLFIDGGRLVGQEDVERLRQEGRSVEGRYREVFQR